MSTLPRLWNYLLHFIFPSFCVSCGTINTHLCLNCYEQIDFLPLPISLKLAEPFLDELIVATNYAPPISTLVHQLKYSGVTEIAQVLGSLLYLTTAYPSADAVTYVPLHPRRQRQRGFNQAELIAKEFSRRTKIPFQALLAREHFHTPQAQVADKEKRKQNLVSAFSISEAAVPLLPSFQTVIIIDDVTTTGTTLNECAKVLKRHGVNRVIGLAVAHGN